MHFKHSLVIDHPPSTASPYSGTCPSCWQLLLPYHPLINSFKDAPIEWIMPCGLQRQPQLNKYKHQLQEFVPEGSHLHLTTVSIPFSPDTSQLVHPKSFPAAAGGFSFFMMSISHSFTIVFAIKRPVLTITQPKQCPCPRGDLQPP